MESRQLKKEVRTGNQKREGLEQTIKREQEWQEFHKKFQEMVQEVDEQSERNYEIAE